MVRAGLLAASSSALARGTTARTFIRRLAGRDGDLDGELGLAHSRAARPTPDEGLLAEASTEGPLSAVAVAAEPEIQCSNGTAGNFQSRPFLFLRIAPPQIRAPDRVAKINPHAKRLRPIQSSSTASLLFAPFDDGIKINSVLGFISIGRPGFTFVFPGDLFMAYVIAEPCIGTKDTACVDVCPVDCIHPRKDEPQFEGEKQLYINPEECIDCGACVPVCPVTAIFALEDLPEKWTSFTPVNADFFKKK
jgi:NAD-dependent dihydropyrimidine dehydrogenase PreA subunit